MNSFLEKEDYEEPCCPLNMNQATERINTRRVISTLDGYLGRNDYEGAERHLKYWVAEAENGRDMHGKLTVTNELIGLYRKVGKEKECVEAIEESLRLVELLELTDTISYGTTLVNAATGYKAFSKPEKAMPLYRKAQEVYEKMLGSDDGKLGALYNNMALALCELGEYKEAESYYFKALEIMKLQEFGELEEAITYLNLIDLKVAEMGQEASEAIIEEYITRAEELLKTESIPRNGYYAFVCEKCAPVFGYYGYFMLEMEFKNRAKEIYERNRTV
ncbi:MAG: tetratricopeptide repeat protein [Erysipelotrichaceae bacterium]|nr:tetratricopeptide repeat protein [Erysipelotrichaceae bacterium]